ncbi:MAG: hypothetical protein WA705_09660, partial [Candidatus Ozemobacteraceae bacterium]
MTIKKKISVFLLSFVLLFVLFIALNAFWLNSIKEFLGINLFHNLSIARNYETLASSWLSLRLRSPDALKFSSDPFFWIASGSFESIVSLEQNQKKNLGENQRLHQFEIIQAHSKKIWEKVQLVHSRD